MPGSSRQSPRKRLIPSPTARAALRERVGAFVRRRRDELGLSQGDIIAVLGYKSRNAVSNIEVGIEGLPSKRAYAWADILEVPRDAFYRFVTGETEKMEIATSVNAAAGDQLSSAESELVAAYRRLPPKYQRRLRDTAREFDTLARTER